MSDFDNHELWASSDEDEEFQDYRPITEDAMSFTLELRPEGQSGGYHVRNRPGEIQRVAATQFHSGPRKRPAFNVGANARAIIHGTLDEMSNTPATLLIYDFSFLSHRSTRIKSASISFEFRAKRGSASLGPTVVAVAPFGKHTTMQTTETVTNTIGADGGLSGGAVVNVNAGLHTEKSVEKTTTHAAEIVGNNPCDEWSNYFLAQWSLDENKSQRSGIVTLFRVCILLTRDTDEEFDLVPDVHVRPNLTTRLGSLVAFRRSDDPIRMAPTNNPFNTLEKDLVQERWHLGDLNLDGLWDCTFYNRFEDAIKASRPSATVGDGVNKVTTIVETKLS
ncbi:hypothetical protein LX32DRAFT_666857 [Colletotrichum zoysiae]|uniref:Uncharacterized protein n=1 Tax=Colletotrichum zoysiae TaxID=1216348 RepID=A0AAD9H995_9PEZI|nr:hypothetical protein LX32DRAFT_666857 [Colletotrichum zoysiae]